MDGERVAVRHPSRSKARVERGRLVKVPPRELEAVADEVVGADGEPGDRPVRTMAEGKETR